MVKLTDEEKIEVVRRYTSNISITCSQLAKDYGVTCNSIIPLLRRRGVKIRNDRSRLMRRYEVDESYFEKIDTKEKAYFLGLLYADGCNHDNYFDIVLHKRDKEILIKFKKDIKYNGKLQNIKNRNQFRLLICRQKICKDLKALGCIPRKSLVLVFPTTEQVPDYLVSHFIRGVFDGDGCISRRNDYNRTFRANIVSSKKFLLKLKEKIKEILNIECRVNDKTDNGFTGVLWINTQCDLLKFLEWIYKDTDLYLKRKYKKYLKFKKSYLS